MNLTKYLNETEVQGTHQCSQCNRTDTYFCNNCGDCHQCCKGHLFTIGYGGLSNINEFVEALYRYNILFLVDVRRKGTKAYLNCFRSIQLANNLYSAFKIHYVHLPELANYHNQLPMKKHPNFNKSLKYLINLINKTRNIVLLCSENPGIDPRKNNLIRCHRIEIAQHIFKKIDLGSCEDIWIRKLQPNDEYENTPINYQVNKKSLIAEAIPIHGE